MEIQLLRAHATDGATNTMIRENRDTAPPGALLALGDVHMDSRSFDRAMFYFAHCTSSETVLSSMTSEGSP